jgi:cell division protein FtsZ
MIGFEQEYGNKNRASLARIKVIGVGGAGGNTVNNMLQACYENVEFIVANTDAQVLKLSQASSKIQLGSKSTRGLGAGANPEIGKRAAEEDIATIKECLAGADVVFVTGGLGGGTGSGALPVVARILKEQGILCIAVVTKPFAFEGRRRMAIAQQALELLKKEVDTLIVIPNQKLLDIADQNVSLINAFDMINGVINQFVRSIADIIIRPGHINVDFADVTSIMRNMGLAVMGTGRASGPHRAEQAARQAITSPLLENVTIEGARSVLLNITGNASIGLQEVSTAASVIYKQAHVDANIIFGSVIDESMGDEISVTVIAAGFSSEKEMAQSASSMSPVHGVSAALPAEISPLQNKVVSESMKGEASEHLDIEIPTILRRMTKEQQDISFKNQQPL